jgi:hypothetical protein
MLDPGGTNEKVANGFGFAAVQFGDSRGKLIPLQPGGNVIDFGNGEGLTITTGDDGKIKVSTVVRDRSGELIARLEENEWSEKPANRFDRNYSDSALEIIDDWGDVVLQVRLVGNVVQLQGKFYSREGRATGIGKVWDDLEKDFVGTIEFRPSSVPLALKIKPIFKYPSERHIGELVTLE